MPDFLKLFFPNVYEQQQTGAASGSQYCKFNDVLLQLFTSSLFLAGMIARSFSTLFTLFYPFYPFYTTLTSPLHCSLPMLPSRPQCFLPLCSIPASPLTRRWGRKPSILIAAVLYIVGSVLVTIARKQLRTFPTGMHTIFPPFFSLFFFFSFLLSLFSIVWTFIVHPLVRST